MISIAIVVGSKNDIVHILDGLRILQEFKITYDCQIVSAHRTPDWLFTFAKHAKHKYQLVIAGAGGSAHLPGMIASLTDLPVIGVPIYNHDGKSVNAPLMSMLHMPTGVPVAVIDGMINAVWFAIRLLALHDDHLKKQLMDAIKTQTDEVLLENKNLNV